METSPSVTISAHHYANLNKSITVACLSICLSICSLNITNLPASVTLIQATTNSLILKHKSQTKMSPVHFLHRYCLACWVLLALYVLLKLHHTYFKLPLAHLEPMPSSIWRLHPAFISSFQDFGHFDRVTLPSLNLQLSYIIQIAATVCYCCREWM